MVVGVLARLSAPRVVTAKRGDSISKLVGSSDPAAIGRFIAANDMSGANSVIREGRSYVVPGLLGRAGPEEVATGRRLLRQDNERLETIRAERDREAWFHELGERPWSRAQPPFAEPAALPPPPVREQRWYEDAVDDAARLWLGRAAHVAGLPVGVAKGGWEALQGIVGTGRFVRRLFDADERRQIDQEMRGFGENVGAYAESRSADPRLFWRDVASVAQRMNLDLNPYATPQGETLADELRRRFDIGSRQGEFVANFAPAPVAAAARTARGAAILSKAMRGYSKGADYDGYVKQGYPPHLAAYFAEPYAGMGSHFIPRRHDWIPDWYMNSRFNVVKPKGLTKGEVYKFHYGVDKNYKGGPVPNRRGVGSGWSGEKLGWSKHGVLGQAWYGSPLELRAAGAGGAAGGLLLYGALEDEEDRP